MAKWAALATVRHLKRRQTTPVDPRFRVKGRGTPIEFVRIRTDVRGGRLDLTEKRAIRFEGARVIGVDFHGQRVHNFVAEGGEFRECDFSGTRFDSEFLSGTPQAGYVDCSFRRAHLRDIFAGQSRFERCDFSHATFGHWTPEDAEFVDCTFAGLLSDVFFSGRPIPQRTVLGYLQPRRDRNEFRGNDFRSVSSGASASGGAST